jgi:hypothetical protein
MGSVTFHDSARVGVLLGNVTLRICFVLHLPERILFIKGNIDVVSCILLLRVERFLHVYSDSVDRSCSNVYAIYTTVLFCRRADGEISPNLRTPGDVKCWRHPEGVRLNFLNVY